jgi:hypothetical protein
MNIDITNDAELTKQVLATRDVFEGALNTAIRRGLDIRLEPTVYPDPSDGRNYFKLVVQVSRPLTPRPRNVPPRKPGKRGR